MQKLESTSEAILSRNKKSKVMGVGQWTGKQDWPEQVKWIKVVTEMKIFGFTICSTYQQTLKQTWESGERFPEGSVFMAVTTAGDYCPEG